MYSTIPTHETEEQALLAVKSKQPKRGAAVGAIVAAFILGVACVSVAPQSVSSAGDSLLARTDAADLATRVELTDQVDLDTYDGLQRMGISHDGETLVKVEGTVRLPLPPDRRFFLHVLDAAGREKQAPVELFDLSSTSAAAAITNDNRFAAFCVHANSYALADLPCLAAGNSYDACVYQNGFSIPWRCGAVAFSRDERSVVFGGNYYFVVHDVFNPSNFTEEIHGDPQNIGEFNDLAAVQVLGFAPDGTLAVAGSNNFPLLTGRVSFYSVTGTTVHFLRSIDSQDVEIPWSHRLPIVWSPDSSKLLLGGAFPDPSQDMYVLLDVKTNATMDLKGPSYPPRTDSWTASFSSDGRYVVTRGGTTRPPERAAVMALHDATTGNLTEEFLIPMVQDYPRSPTTDLVAFVPVPPNVDMIRVEKIMVSTCVEINQCVGCTR